MMIFWHMLVLTYTIEEKTFVSGSVYLRQCDGRDISYDLRRVP